MPGKTPKTRKDLQKAGDPRNSSWAGTDVLRGDVLVMGLKRHPIPGLVSSSSSDSNCRNVLCPHAKPFPVSLLVGYKNNHG